MKNIWNKASAAFCRFLHPFGGVTTHLQVNLRKWAENICRNGTLSDLDYLYSRLSLIRYNQREKTIDRQAKEHFLRWIGILIVSRLFNMWQLLFKGVWLLDFHDKDEPKSRKRHVYT